MVKQTPFTVHNLSGKKPSKLATPPSKISESRLSDEWRVAKATRAKAALTAKRTSSKRKKKAGTAKKAAITNPKSAGDLLRVDDGEDACLQCGEYSNSDSCGKQCLREFRKIHFPPATAVEIRGPGMLGYSAFLSPKAASIPKDQFIGEYIGELRPLDSTESLYRFVVPNVCVIDAEQAGNWTRFVNSHCRPNVKPWANYVGKRHLILFQALRQIDPGEEIVFNYGPDYFNKAGIKCGCDAVDWEHIPGDEKVKAVAKKGTAKKAAAKTATKTRPINKKTVTKRAAPEKAVAKKAPAKKATAKKTNAEKAVARKTPAKNGKRKAKK